MVSQIICKKLGNTVKLVDTDLLIEVLEISTQENTSVL